MTTFLQATRNGAPRIVLGAALSLALVLPLAACVPSGSSAPSASSGGPEEGELLLLDVEEFLNTPVRWDSGVLEVFDDVAQLVPEIGPLRGAFETADATQGVSLFGSDGGTGPVAMSAPSPSLPIASDRGTVALAAMSAPRTVAADAVPGAVADASLGANFMVGSMAGELFDMAFLDGGAEGWTDKPVGATQTDGKGVSFTKLDDRNAAVEMSTEHQEVENDVIVKSSFSFKMAGTMCPAGNGDFDLTFTVEQRVTATTRTGESWEQQKLIVNAAGRLGEDAIPERYDVETAQTTTQKHADGTTGYTSSTKARSDLNWAAMETDAPTILGQEGFSQAELDRLTKQGDDRALSLALGQMFALFKHWLLGGCVKIVHDAPSTVDAESTTDVTVETRQRATNVEVRARVTLTLSGRTSIDPEELVTPGGFHYTAGDLDTQATIKVEARSRQGGDTQTITIDVGPPEYYDYSGSWERFPVSGFFCSMDDPFFSHLEPSADPYFSFNSDGTVLMFATEALFPEGYLGLGGQGTWEFVIGVDGRPTAIQGTIDAEYRRTDLYPPTNATITDSFDLEVTPGGHDPGKIEYCTQVLPGIGSE